MQLLAIDPRILRTLVGPDITVVPGRAMMARVVAANPGGRGTLSIAGYLLEAELPEEIQTGMDLRLLVRDVTPERVVLSVADDHAPTDPAPAARDPAPAPTPSAADIAVPLPGGGTVRVTDREARGGGRSSDSGALTLRYETRALGAMDLRLQLDPASLRVTVTVSRGTPLELAQSGSEELRQALSAELRRTATVTVLPRHEPIDLYA